VARFALVHRILFVPWRPARPLRRRFLLQSAIALLALAATAVPAQQVRLLVQSSPLAGFRYHDAPAVFAEIKPGDALALVREPANPHDPNAVRVEWQGRMLGYVPRAENAAVAWALDRGEPLRARVSKVREHPNPRMRVEFEVYIE
jgi:class 3 adenylate cyclase